MPAHSPNILKYGQRTVPRPSIVASAMIWVVRAYQAILGPLLGGHCRFQPTCSHYAIEALQTHGAVRGGLLVLRRLCRCHPFGGSGLDPVPPADRHLKEEPQN